MHFSDETHVDCCNEHLWVVSHADNGWKNRVVDTSYLHENCRRSDGKRVLSINATKPVGFDRKEYVIPPYLMGILLAEGNMTNSNVVFTSCEQEIVQHVNELLSSGYVCKSKGIDYRIVKAKQSSKSNIYKESLRELGIWGKYSYEKFIPECYLYGSVDQRIALLQGMMDGDGTVDKKGGITYCTTSFEMINNFCQLIYSLGGSTRIKRKEGSIDSNGKLHRVSYRCHLNLPNEINIFLLTRKNRLRKLRSKYFPKRYIDRVEKLDKQQDMQCISVDHKDSLYLTDNYTVTHNTHLACAFAISEILNRRRSRIILTRPIVESGEKLGFLPGTFDEKVDPYMLPLYDCMGKLVGWDGPEKEKIDRAVEKAPLAYMRGRSQPLDALVLTPIGYKLMGEIKDGDYVIGSNGLPVKVIGIYPQGNLDVYRVTFTDGVSVECSADHLWSTTNIYERRHNKGNSVKTTAEIAKKIKQSHAYNHQIPISFPVQLEEKELPIDPYVVGALLGDGCLHETASITLTTSDDQIVKEVSRRLPDGIRLTLCKDKNSDRSPQYRVVSCETNNCLRDSMRKFGLLGSISKCKFVPNDYRFASKAQRLELLRGLMDTDGCCFVQKNRKPRVQYYSISKQLAKDVAHLVHTLGGVASVRERKFSQKDNHFYKNKLIKHNENVWIVEIRMVENPFNLTRKANKFVPSKPIRAIKCIEKIGRKACQCIKVDSPDHLYLTENCIVTHNTFDDAVCIFDEAQNASMSQLKLFLTRFGENSKIIVTGDPAQSDLPGHVALVDVVERLKSEMGIGVVEFGMESIVRHPMVGRILYCLGGGSC